MNCMVTEYYPVIHIFESHLHELAWPSIAALFAHPRSLPAPYPVDTGGNLVGRGQNWKRGTEFLSIWLCWAPGDAANPALAARLQRPSVLDSSLLGIATQPPPLHRRAS